MTTAVTDSQTLAASAVPRPPEAGVRLLMGLRWTMFRNDCRQVIRERPLKLIGPAASVLLIWIGLYALLVEVFRFVHRDVLEGIVATQAIFTFFFLTLTGMLAFSNAILCYGLLFKRQESAYLLSSPVRPRDVVIMRYLESLLLSSWSLLLLGVPLMLAMARTFDEPWTFYPLFLGLFILFIPLPGAIGLLASWLLVRCFPKTPWRALVTTAVVVLTIAGIWAYRTIGAPVSSGEWLSNFYRQFGLIQNKLLPHNWVANGINYAVQGQRADALFYLYVTFANAAFASLVAVYIVSSRFVPAFARAQVSGSRAVGRSGKLIAWLAEILFAYLPRPQRLLAAKDLKTFFRDPLQWTQMAILFGLLAFYVTNVQGEWMGTLWTDNADPRAALLIAFLNISAVSLILATFTSRFVFPLISLDGQQLWLLGLLPLRRSRLITAKFLYALTVTLVVALAVMAASCLRLALPRGLVIAHLVSAAAICIGLCGVSTGMGARMPVFNERNPARITGGFGGTISLLMSIGLVAASLTGVGIMTFQAVGADSVDTLTGSMRAWLIAVVLFNLAGAAICLMIGIRHFNRVQC